MRKKEKIKHRKKYPNSKAELSWIKVDYEAFGYEAPERVIRYPDKTEGEMMSEEEIECWFVNNLKLLPVVKEEHPELFPELYKGFCLDIEYLFSLGRVSEEVAEFVFDQRNFEF